MEIASSRTQFMKRLVAFSDRHRLTLELAYSPPYHSKYNLIERCWSILENNWSGTLLTSIETTLEWAKTMTWRRPDCPSGGPRLRDRRLCLAPHLPPHRRAPGTISIPPRNEASSSVPNPGRVFPAGCLSLERYKPARLASVLGSRNPRIPAQSCS